MMCSKISRTSCALLTALLCACGTQQIEVPVGDDDPGEQQPMDMGAEDASSPLPPQQDPEPDEESYDYGLRPQSELPETIAPSRPRARAVFRLINVGEATWQVADDVMVTTTPSNDFSLEPTDPRQGFCLSPGDCRLKILEDVPRNGEVDIELDIILTPEQRAAPGVYTLAVTMVRGEDFSFGPEQRVQIQVCEPGECQGAPEQDMGASPVEDMGTTEPMDMGQPEEDMAPPEPPGTYCQVNATDGLRLRDCPAGVTPGTSACPTILTTMGHLDYVEELDVHANGWRQLRHLNSSLVGWATSDWLTCPVEPPEDPCADRQTTAQRIAACNHPLLNPTGAPSSSDDLLYYVNRWYSIDKCFPTAVSASIDSKIRPYVQPEMRDVCGSYPGVSIINVPSTYAEGSQRLRQIAWDSPAPAGMATTHDGKTVGYQGRVGFKAMFDAAKAERGYTFKIFSGFRSVATQYNTFNSWVQREGGDAARASVYSAKPTHSEHQLGTTADFTYWRNGVRANPFSDPVSFAASPEGTWLRENAHRFGIAITYTAEHVEQHQYQPEPWHIRYLGVEAADAMRQCNLSSEELLNHRYQIGALPAFPNMDLVYSRMVALGYTVCR